MAIMQPQKPPRGLAMILCKAVCRALDRENKKRKYRVPVHVTLRALEWTRYRLTESLMEQFEEIARKKGGTSFVPLNIRKKGKGQNGQGGMEFQ